VKTAFGPFVFDRAHQLLAREGLEVPLPPRVIGVLDVLTARPGQIVSKQELIETVWKDAFVSDTSLAEAVSFLRQALGDDPQQPSYIQTVHRRGYRFLPPGPTPAAAVVAAALPEAPPRDSLIAVLPWAIAVVLAAMAASAIWRLSQPDAPVVFPVTRFDVALPTGTALDTASPSIAMSADGARIAFSACAADGCRIFTRRMEDTRTEPIAGTEGGIDPFLSPDGTQVGFFADGKVKTVAVSGGSVVSVADARRPMGGAWLDDGSIVFSGRVSDRAEGLLRAGGNVGAARVAREIDRRSGELALAWPEPLPGGRVVLATAILAPGDPLSSRIVAIALDTGQRSVVLERASFARFVPPNTLVFVRQGDLLAAAFDASQLKISGQSVVVVPGVGEQAAEFAVSRVGSFAAATDASPLPALAWVSRDGGIDPLPSGFQRLTSASLSHDGRRIVALTEDEGRTDVWSTDIARGASSRLTFEGEQRAPLWVAGDRAVLFAARSAGVFNLHLRALDSSSPRRLTTSAHHQTPTSASPDGRLVALTDFDPATGADIWTVPAAGGSPSAVVRTPFDESGATFSPDGRWMAYQSNESNRWEIYVRPFGRAGGAVAISVGGGTAPVWSGDGRTVFYAGAGGVMSVDVGAAACAHDEACELSPSRPVEIVRGPWLPRGTGADGRLLVERIRGRIAPPDRLSVTLQWTRELQRRVPAAVVSSPK
jgi:serine/threonine-protein kinase